MGVDSQQSQHNIYLPLNRTLNNFPKTQNICKTMNTLQLSMVRPYNANKLYSNDP